MNTIQISGRVTLADLQRQIDEIEDKLENLPTKYTNPRKLGQFYEDQEDAFR